MSGFSSAASFDQLPALLRTLAARGEPRRYRKGTVLIHEGDQGDTLFILLSGRVKVCSMDARGREIVYGVYGPGEYLGEMSLDGGPRSASVITLEAVACVVVARQTLREHIAANPDFAFELLGRVIRRARLATQSTRDLALLDVYGRLVNLFESLAVVREDGTRVLRERMTHQEIASRVGCSREMVSRLMKDLERGGYLSTQGSVTTIASRLPAHW
jgi:CRP/FNR family cyclic AMP-dependent transcriptional regulator